MTNLSDYIIAESIDIDNLFYKVDKWFDGHDSERTSFIELVNQSKAASSNINIEELEKYVSDAKFKLKNFVEFTSDEVNAEIGDYMYVFKKIVDTISADQSNKLR